MILLKTTTRTNNNHTRNALCYGTLWDSKSRRKKGNELRNFQRVFIGFLKDRGLLRHCYTAVCRRTPFRTDRRVSSALFLQTHSMLGRFTTPRGGSGVLCLRYRGLCQRLTRLERSRSAPQRPVHPRCTRRKKFVKIDGKYLYNYIVNVASWLELYIHQRNAKELL